MSEYNQARCQNCGRKPKPRVKMAEETLVVTIGCRCEERVIEGIEGVTPQSWEPETEKFQARKMGEE